MTGPGTSTADDPRADLVERAKAIRDRWRRLAADVGEERMELPGPMGEWSFKDLASHLSAWRRRTIGRVLAAGRGVPPPPNPWPTDLGEDEDDLINAWIHEQTRDHPLEDVLATAQMTAGDFVRTNKQVLDLLRQIESVAGPEAASAARAAHGAVNRSVVAYTGV